MPVDELDQCNKMVGKDDNQGSKARKYFPFKQSYPFVATLRVGSEGIQMTVDGKHITSFAFREVIFLSSSSYFLLFYFLFFFFFFFFLTFSLQLHLEICV